MVLAPANCAALKWQNAPECQDYFFPSLCLELAMTEQSVHTYEQNNAVQPPNANGQYQ
jgi:hypothetical protein